MGPHQAAHLIILSYLLSPLFSHLLYPSITESYSILRRMTHSAPPPLASMQKFTSSSPFSPSQLLLADLKGSVIVLRERKPSLRSPWLSHKAKEESLRCVSRFSMLCFIAFFISFLKLGLFFQLISLTGLKTP